MATEFLPIPTQIATDTSTSAEKLSESWRVRTWRLAQLAEAGYGDDVAAVLAMSPEVDLHRATDLLLNGCPQQTAVRILL